MLEPARTVADLHTLRQLTGDQNGAQRVAFSAPWFAARAFLRRKLAELPVMVETDAAGNLWATLPGGSEQELWIGGHLGTGLPAKVAEGRKQKANHLPPEPSAFDLLHLWPPLSQEV